jgi:hypothetical protein
MFMKKPLETERDEIRRLEPGETVTTVPVERTTQRQPLWIDTMARTAGRQRRMARALRRMIGGLVGADLVMNNIALTRPKALNHDLKGSWLPPRGPDPFFFSAPEIPRFSAPQAGAPTEPEGGAMGYALIVGARSRARRGARSRPMPGPANSKGTWVS